MSQAPDEFFAIPKGLTNPPAVEIKQDELPPLGVVPSGNALNAFPSEDKMTKKTASDPAFPQAALVPSRNGVNAVPSDDKVVKKTVSDPGENYESLKLILKSESKDGKPSETEDEVVENLVMEFSKESMFHGSIVLDDVKEILKFNGDFLVRTPDSKTKRAPDGSIPVAIVAVRAQGGVREFPMMFLKHGVDQMERLVTLNGLFVKSTITDLLRQHMDMQVPIEGDVVLKKPVTRQSWQLPRDHVTLDSKIGEGAFGEVWKGKLTIDKPNTPPKDVAVKVTKISEDNKSKMEEMMVEARLMRQLNHVNVVAFYGMVSDAGQCMIVMELVHGGSLDNHLKKNKDIPLGDKCSYCFDVAYGLFYLHKKQTIHRDMAARNCLIDVANTVVKLSDFGMSKRDTKYKIQANERTPIRWQAPEVLKTGMYTKECDVYSFGMVMFEIFNHGKVPFEGTENKVIRAKIQDPSFRPKIPEDSPIEIQAVMNGCWHADPKKRCSMRNAAGILQKFRKQRGVKRDDSKEMKVKPAGATKSKPKNSNRKTPKSQAGRKSNRAETPNN